MDNYFQNIFPKISGSQEDNQISIFGCPHSFFGRRGHEDTRILLPWIHVCAPMVEGVHVWTRSNRGTGVDTLGSRGTGVYTLGSWGKGVDTHGSRGTCVDTQ